ncbi:MAG: O-antigen ligase family protein [Betaproteobacteria bacterium]|nr:O-antigen ligase family protein [Betaproteobacteria bacterium]
MERMEGRAERSSLLVFGAALILLVGSLLAGNGYRWGAIALLALACAPWRALPANSLGLITALFCAWLFINAVLITPVYAAEGMYLPLILFGGFASIATRDRESSVWLFCAGVALLSILVLVGLLQYFFGFWHLSLNPVRAAATFVTPNTFATAINLFLLPLAALYLAGRGSAKIYALALWLFAGLVATQSRAGLIAFLAGLLFIAACIGTAALWRGRNSVLRLFAGWIAVWFAFDAVTIMLAGIDGSSGSLPSWDRWQKTNADSGFRTKIYAATFDLIFDRPFAGAGANMFNPLIDRLKDETFRDSSIPFAHSDYLQVWLEYGAAGLVLLITLVVVALMLAWRSARRNPDDPMPLACGAALASCFAHAAVDFPLYVPFTLMIAGAYLGALAACAGDGERLNAARTREIDRMGQAVAVRMNWLVAIVALAWLSQPVLADLASAEAVAELRAGRADGGLYWASVARRLEPRNVVHYWAEAVIWRDQAEASGDRGFAVRADALFSEGIRVNPYEIASYVELARMHRQHSSLFERPRTPQEILGWTSKALELRPDSLLTHAEHARALAFAGRVGEARRMVAGMMAWHPEAKLTRELAAELLPAD